jgi:hypothetical protein
VLISEGFEAVNPDDVEVFEFDEVEYELQDD